MLQGHTTSRGSPGGTGWDIGTEQNTKEAWVLPNCKPMIPASLEHAKGHQYYSNQPTEFSSGTKTEFTCIMAATFKSERYLVF